MQRTGTTCCTGIVGLNGHFNSNKEGTSGFISVLHRTVEISLTRSVSECSTTATGPRAQCTRLDSLSLFVLSSTPNQPSAIPQSNPCATHSSRILHASPAAPSRTSTSRPNHLLTSPLPSSPSLHLIILENQHRPHPLSPLLPVAITALSSSSGTTNSTVTRCLYESPAPHHSSRFSRSPHAPSDWRTNSTAVSLRGP